MKIITDEVLKLLDVHEKIVGYFNNCFENQAANEEYQRKRIHDKYKKDIEKTRKLFLALWLKEVNNVINPPKDKIKVIVENSNTNKHKKLSKKQKMSSIRIDDVTKAVEELQNIADEAMQNVVVEDNSTTKQANSTNMQEMPQKEINEETKQTQNEADN